MKKLFALLFVGGLLTLAVGCPPASTPTHSGGSPLKPMTPTGPMGMPGMSGSGLHGGTSEKATEKAGPAGTEKTTEKAGPAGTEKTTEKSKKDTKLEK